RWPRPAPANCSPRNSNGRNRRWRPLPAPKPATTCSGAFFPSSASVNRRESQFLVAPVQQATNCDAGRDLPCEAGSNLLSLGQVAFATQEIAMFFSKAPKALFLGLLVLSATAVAEDF